jgi:hypothetical protein
VGAIFSAHAQTGPGAHPASYTMVKVCLPVVKRQGRNLNQLPPTSARVKERTELHLYSTSGPSWSVLGQTLPSSYLIKKVKVQQSLYRSGKDLRVPGG